MEINKITIKERGATPRGMARAYNKAAKKSYHAAISYFHQTYRAKRFTVAHARAAGYALRQGENVPYGSKEFWRSYTGRKLRKFKHRSPLKYTGQTERRARTVNITATSKQGKGRYSLPALNYRNLGDEFRRVLPHEARQLGRIYDQTLNVEIKNDREQTTRTI